jgi:hypothetical protein
MRKKKLTDLLSQKRQQERNNPKKLELLDFYNKLIPQRNTNSPANTLGSPLNGNRGVALERAPKLKKSGMHKFRREKKEPSEADRIKTHRKKSPVSADGEQVDVEVGKNLKAKKISKFSRL